MRSKVDDQNRSAAPGTSPEGVTPQIIPVFAPAQGRPAPRRARWILWVLILGLCILVAWAAIGTVDQVTRAPATVVAAARTQIIQAPDGGVLTELLVKEGDSVKSGQILATLQKERVAAAASESEAKVAALRITLARLNAEVYGKPLHFDTDLLTYKEYIRNQTELYHKRRTAIQEDLASLENISVLAQKELKMNRELVASRDVSAADILRLERSAADVQAQIVSRRNKYFQDAQTEMTKAQEDLATQTEQLRDRTQLLEHTDLVAPVNGVVNNIKVNTLGGVLRAGDTLMELLPTGGDLMVEAKVSPTDIASVSLGQVAHVRIDAYESAVFGALRGEVSYISSDVLVEETRQGPSHYYKVSVLLKESEFKSPRLTGIVLRPGMSASVDIKARERTVLSYLTRPITKSLGQSFGER